MGNEIILDDMVEYFASGRLERVNPIKSEIRVMLEKAYELGYESGMSQGTKIDKL